MIGKDGKVKNHIVRLDIEIEEGEIMNRERPPSEQELCLASIRLIQLLGYTNITKVKITKI